MMNVLLLYANESHVGMSYSSNTTATSAYSNTQVFPRESFSFGLYPVVASFFFEQSCLLFRFSLESFQPDVTCGGNEDYACEEKLLVPTVVHYVSSM